jgi:GAF domain-containing protein
VKDEGERSWPEDDLFRPVVAALRQIYCLWAPVGAVVEFSPSQHVGLGAFLQQAASPQHLAWSQQVALSQQVACPWQQAAVGV